MSNMDSPVNMERSIHELCIEGDSDALGTLLVSSEASSDLLLKPNEDSLFPIQLVLLNAKHSCLTVLLQHGADLTMQFTGLFPLHLAFALSCFDTYKEDCTRCVEVLLTQEDIEVNARDRLGRTALHVACAAGMTEAMALLFEKKADGFMADFTGKYPIHCAIERNWPDAVRVLFSECGHSISVLKDGAGNMPVHLSVLKGSWESLSVLLEICSSSILAKQNESCQTVLDLAVQATTKDVLDSVLLGNYSRTSKASTLLVTHDICREHASLPASFREVREYLHQQRRNQAETPHRLELLTLEPFGLLTSDLFTDKLDWIKDPPPALIADVLRVHDYSYYSELDVAVRSLTPESVPRKFDRDTYITSTSLCAALYACGSVITAIDKVMDSSYRNAFCCVRPPGHHVGPIGAVSSEEDPAQTSLGFCLLNNAAIGAAYALYSHQRTVHKVAIIDFDVHHGNGTEAIVNNLKPHKLQFNIGTAPLSGHIELHSYKPWLTEKDHQNVLFVSSHAYGNDGGGRFYPASGRDSSGPEDYPAGILNLPCAYGTDSLAFRNLYRDLVFPRLLDFSPDLLVLSAGFDGHELDKINYNFMSLDEDDFYWVTEELMKVANSCCGGRVVSVLEGGYSVKGGVISPFSQSVGAHVQALANCTKEKYFRNANRENDAMKVELKRKHGENAGAMKLRRHRLVLTPELLEMLNQSSDSEGTGGDATEDAMQGTT